MAPRDPKTPSPFGVPIHSVPEDAGTNGDRSGKITVDDLADRPAAGEQRSREPTKEHKHHRKDDRTAKKFGDRLGLWAGIAASVVAVVAAVVGVLWYVAPRATTEDHERRIGALEVNLAADHAEDRAFRTYMTDETKRQGSEIDGLYGERIGRPLPPTPPPALVPPDGGE